MARAPKQPQKELQTLFRRGLSDFTDAMERILGAMVTGNMQEQRQATATLGNVTRRTQALADLSGRHRVFLEQAHAARIEERLVREEAETVQAGRLWTPQAAYLVVCTTIPGVPDVTFESAIQNFIERAPAGFATDATRSASELVADVYNFEHGFALAQDQAGTMVGQVQRVIAQGARGEISAESAKDVIAELGPWTRNYAATVYETNLNSAFNAGRMMAAQDPDVQDILPAFEYVAILDADLRSGPPDSEENHRVLHGMIAATNSGVWDEWSPPGGYR